MPLFNLHRVMRGIRPHALVAIVGMAAGALALNNGVALLPPMGWNTFNQFHGNWTVADLKANADSLIATGLADCGYIYCNNDGNNGGPTPYWPGQPGFVAWAKPIADYMHSLGLKFGTYMTTTSNAAATVQDLVAAECDYIKHDDWIKGSADPVFSTMRDALLATKRPIVYSIHSGSEVLTPDLAHLCRTGRDITAEWPVIMECYDKNYTFLSQSGPGAWADPDMLEVGCRAASGWVLTPDEDRAHFSMWCMMAAPLIIGYDLSRTYALTRGTWEHHVRTIAILSNIELIAVNQDSLGKAGLRIKGQGAREVWVKPLKDGSKAVAFFNRTSAVANISISQAELGWATEAQIYVRDLWTHTNLAPFTGTFTKSVAVHAAEVYRMSPQPISGVERQLRKMDRARRWLERNGCFVFPRSMELRVMSGEVPAIKVFDLRGRALASVQPVMAGAGMFVGRLRADDAAGAGKFIWPGR